MRILLTNDDGIRAPGIIALYRALVDRDGDLGGRLGGTDTEIFVVAPETVQSATSHGVTFHEPLMVRPTAPEAEMEGIAVDGRPADCVKLAISQLWPERFGEGSRPDLAISGLNAGANCGINVIYSGTVAAALEAAFLGVPSFAMSLLMGRQRPDFALASARARRTIDHILNTRPPSGHECLNVNIPKKGDDDAMPKISVCPMNTHGLVDSYVKRTSPAGDTYYWASGHGLDFHSTEPGSDVDRLFAGEISITPLMYNLTSYEHIEGWRRSLNPG